MRLIHRADHVDPADAPDTARPAEVHTRSWSAVALSVVTTADGTVAVNGRSGPLGSSTDREVLQALRSVSDWVLVGAATVRAEGYGAPSNPNLRIAVVSRSGTVDPDSALFASGRGVLVLPESAPVTTHTEIRVSNPRDPDSVDLAGALVRMGGRRVLAEGGPTLSGQLLQSDLVGTMFVTFAPFAGRGGDSLARFSGGSTPEPVGFRLAWLYEDEGWLFARYDRVRPA